MEYRWHLFHDNRVLLTVRSPSTSSSLWLFSANLLLNPSITKSRNPKNFQWLAFLQAENVGQGLPQEMWSAWKPNIWFISETCRLKHPGLRVHRNHTEKNEEIFFSNRRAYKSKQPTVQYPAAAPLQSECDGLETLRKRREMHYRPLRKASASPRSVFWCCCPSAPCDPLERFDKQNWFCPVSGLCFRGPRNINFHKLFWRTITQCRFNWKRQ